MTTDLSRFADVRAEAVAPTLDAALAEADRWVAEALALDRPSFDDVFRRLDHAGRLVRQAYGVTGGIRDVHPDTAVQEAARAASEAIDRWAQGLVERAGVAEVVESFADGGHELDEEQRALLARWQLDVRDAGLRLDAADRRRLAELREVTFGAPVQFMPALSRPQVVAIRRDEADGLPGVIVDGFGEPGPDGTWAVTLDDAVVTAVIESATNRSVRERVVRGWLSRGLPETRDILDELTVARREIARLLGRPSWLALRADRMAIGGVDAVEAFLDGLEARLDPLALADLEAMRQVLVEETGDPGAVLEEWDYRFADARLRARSGADPGAFRDYLPFDACLDAVASLGESVFGVRLQPRPERSAWHPDVQAFDLVDRDSGTLIAALFLDPYARQDKGSNAWADVLDPGDDGTFGEPRPRVMVLVTNAPAPVDGVSTISLFELETLFHEYGHVLDFALDGSRWWPIRDDWERYDWVEGPSQFLGHWAKRPEVLRTIGRHVETGDPIPEPMLASLAELEGLNTAFQVLRWVSMARLDGLLHGPDPITVEEADARAWAVRRIPRVEGALFAGTFAHLLGGYDAAIHGFSWDEVLRADLEAGFREGGLLSPQVGAAYRSAVLEAPWTLEPVERVARFRGRPWSFEPFLRELGT